MTKVECAMAARLLAIAADEFETHVCNDWPQPATPENVEFARAVERDAGCGENELSDPVDGEINMNDATVMRYLADKLAVEGGIEAEGT